jgi:hypothetical protein
LLLALLLPGISCSSLYGFFLILLPFVSILIVILIISAFLIFSIHSEHVEVLVKAKIVLKSIGDKEIVEILNDLLNLINLVLDFVLFLTLSFTLLLSLLILEDIEKRLSINSLYNSPGLSSFLVFLLLLDFFLSGVFALNPLNLSASDFLHFVLNLIL